MSTSFSHARLGTFRTLDVPTSGVVPAGYNLDEMRELPEEETPSATTFERTAGGWVTRPVVPPYSLVEHERPDVAQLARFAHRVEFAAFHMCVALEAAGVRDVAPVAGRRPRWKTPPTWFAALAETTFDRFQHLRNALVHDWTPPVRVEPLMRAAFQCLCDLTPAASHYLRQLYDSRRDQAIEKLVSQLDLIVQLLEEAVGLADDAKVAGDEVSDKEAAIQLAANQAAILERAGEGLGLRDAAKRLGMSHQNLHRRIRTRSALGVVVGRELVIPIVQFVEANGKLVIVEELASVLRLFDEAGAGLWSALQFLVETDPHLGARPIDRLKAGELGDVLRAARGLLGLEES